MENLSLVLEFDIRNCFHTIDRHRLISIFKEEIDDPKFFYSIQKVFSAGRLVGGQVVLMTKKILEKKQASTLPRQQSHHCGSVKSIQRKAAFHSLVSSWHTSPQAPPAQGDQKTPFVFPLRRHLPPSLTSLELLCAAFLIESAGPKAEFYGRERCNWAMRDLFKYCKRKGLLIELGGEAILVIRSEKRLARKLAPLKTHYLRNLSYARYADDLLLGIVGAVELLIEIQKRIAQFLQSGLNLWVGSEGSTTIAARSTVEFLGTVIREVPPRTTPIQFFRELEKRLRVKHRIHITVCHLRSAIHSKFRNLGKSIPKLTKEMSETGSLLDGIQLAPTLGTAGVRSPQVSVLWGTVKHIRQGSRGISLLHSSGRSNAPSDVQQAVSRSGMSVRKLSLPAGRKAAGEGGGHWAESISSEFSIQIEAPIKKILRRLRDRGIISRIRPWPIHVACLTSVSDGEIVNWFAGIAISLMSYYRCCDNLYQVRTIVDYQIRWSAIFTLAHKHKSSARNIILKYSKDLKIVNKEGGKTLAEFPNSIELGKLGPGQDPNKNSHSTTSLV
uniref:Reverse transcriptase domain-containing protein n=1 Tax=Salix viminalis TaxID=40686 RepID=A0A6N2KY77_SALVM